MWVLIVLMLAPLGVEAYVPQKFITLATCKAAMAGHEVSTCVRVPVTWMEKRDD